MSFTNRLDLPESTYISDNHKQKKPKIFRNNRLTIGGLSVSSQPQDNSTIPFY
jgi:hypothetical protein